MSNLNFSKWDLSESKKAKTTKKVRRVNAEELVQIMLQEQENLGFWKNKYDTEEVIDDATAEDLTWADRITDEEDAQLQSYYAANDLADADDAAASLFASEIEDAEFAGQPGVTVVDDPVDAGMFEMDNPLEQGATAITLDEQDADDRSLEGLEGPFNFNGRELYYDSKEGAYYDRGTDMYLDNDEASKVVMGEQDEDIIDFSGLSLDDISLDEQDELNIDVTDQGDAGSFYTGEEGDEDLTGGGMDMDEQNILQRVFGKQSRELPKVVKKKSDLPVLFMAWVDAYKRGGASPKTKQMLANKVIDEIGATDDKVALENLSHWINYNPKAMADIWERLKADAEGQMTEDDSKSMPEPFWSYGFPQVKLRDMAEALMDSMIPGGRKQHTLEIIKFMRDELDALETKITTEK